MSDQTDTNEMLVTLTADIVAAHVSNNSVAVSDLPLLINNVHAALTGLGVRAGRRGKAGPRGVDPHLGQARLSSSALKTARS